MSSPKQAAEKLVRRSRLLDAVRGHLGSQPPPTSVERHHLSAPQGHRRPLKSFPLYQHHVQPISSIPNQPATPSDFHSSLCDLIRNAKQRVYLASLYVGPAASPNHKREQELLNALQEVTQGSSVDVKVILDKNRALRPVPSKQTTTTSSAQAVATAIQQSPQHASLHLLQVLSPSLAKILPNPINEVAGVFHIKAYIIDDVLILSGANLSEEYFSDRQDRYTMIVDGGAGLVDFYAQLVELLCDHAETYDTETGDSAMIGSAISQDEFVEQLLELFTDDKPQQAADLFQLKHDTSPVAVAVPTFQAPTGFLQSSARGGLDSFLSDTESTNRLLEEGVKSMDPADEQAVSSVKISSAYLNPTLSLLDRLKLYPTIDLLSAGRVSHGFRPKKKAGNKGKDWIPTVFDRLADTACRRLPNARLWHWEREGWTFHSKGLWLFQTSSNQQQPLQDEEKDLIAAIVGSANYGARSHYKDMESNCILVFSPDSKAGNDSWKHDFVTEWKTTMSSAVSVDKEKILDPDAPMPFYVRMLQPFIKDFF